VGAEAILRSHSSKYISRISEYNFTFSEVELNNDKVVYMPN